MKHSGWDYLDHMIKACEELFFCLRGIKSEEEFGADIKARRAVVMCLLDLGELFTHLSDKERDEYPSDHWHRIVGFRNRSAHGYQNLDFKMVYAIAVNRVPPLYAFLKKKQQEMENE